MPGVTLHVDICAGRVGIDAAVSSTEPEEHQLRLVVQLHAQPVPADLVFRKLVGEPFVIHPRHAGHGVLRAVDVKLARYIEPRERDIV